MRIYIVDAFAERPFAGNAAGIVLLEGDFPEEKLMQSITTELKHSETAFVRRIGADAFAVRFFTPLAEVALCGHATIAAFAALRDMENLPKGLYTLHAKAEDISIFVEEKIWMEMEAPRILRTLDAAETAEIYAIMGQKEHAGNLRPKIVQAGLADIQLPVASQKQLYSITPDYSALAEFSKKCGVCGVHAFCLPDEAGYTAHCRNFAPLFGIDEESATGTANAGLTQYLLQEGKVKTGDKNIFLQGEKLGRPSKIYTCHQGKKLRLGGNANVVFTCSPCFLEQS